MPVRTRRALQQFRLLELPEEVVFRIVNDILKADLEAGLCIARVSKTLLNIVREASAPRRLQWLAEASFECSVMPNTGGSSITRTGPSRDWAWAAGTLLPCKGVFSWQVRIDREACAFGAVFVGVCDATNRHAWGVYLHTGKLMQMYRSDDLRRIPERSYEVKISAGGEVGAVPPPAGYPKGHGVPFLFGRHGRPAKVIRSAEHAVLELTYDADEGSLAYRVELASERTINDGRSVQIKERFPPGVALRPWALLNCLDGAHTRFTRRCDPLGDTITLSKFRAGD